MNFYKILFHSSKKTIPLHKQLLLDDKALIGKNGYSFGIEYSPESYNKWLMDEGIFEIFVKCAVKQLLMTNYKFLNVIKRQEEFNLKIVDCKLEDNDINSFLQGETISPEILDIIFEDIEYRILQVYFRSRDMHMITLKSNGVLGIDNGLSEDEINDVKKLIDFLGFGPVVLK